MHTVHVSVRHLVEFIMRSGSIDTGFFISGIGTNRALEGTRVHKRIQSLRKKEAAEIDGSYQKEVPLRTDYEYKGICFCIEGRADGIFTIDGQSTIEEIKSTLLPLSRLEKDTDHWHWAQAKCYAYIYAISQEADEMACSLIYGQVETDESVTFTEKFSFAALKSFVLGLVEKYWDFAQLEITCKDEAYKSGTALSFPYETYRGGQREMAVAVYAAIRHKKKLFAQAPTGIGKTMAALFSAVKALAEGMGEKIFYITSKTVQRHIAEGALQHMSEAGLIMRSITLTAKDKICFKETRACNPVQCNYADGHFDRVNEAILDCIRNETIITREIVENYARKHVVCPAEYAFDLALFCHVIICDYNHIYDPKAKLRRFFADGGDFILLQDEAHNLVDRSREMFSAGVHRKEFSSLRKELGRSHPLYKSLGAVAKQIRGFSKEDDQTDIAVTAGLMAGIMAEFAADCELCIKEDPQSSEDILPAYFSALDFIKTAELFDGHYTVYRETDYIRLFCLDPSYLLGIEQKKSRTSVFFSATLSPLPYFQGILGGGQSEDGEDYHLRLGSPFPRENLCMIVESRVSTKYKHREQSLNMVAESLHSMVSAKAGNYMAFFPSYAYLNQVYERFTEQYSDVNLIRQHQGAGNEQEILEHFEDQDNKTLLGFVVLGGAFSEGIDLKGGRLIGAAVVGVGMPLISRERDIIADYFTANGKKGFDYAYIYPGMNKVLQAAGRVIRSEYDQGVVLLIDSRYSEEDYRSLFPAEWSGYIKLKGRDRLEDALRVFWQSKL